MDNKGDEPLRVPGFGSMPLDEELPISERFAHGFNEWAQVPTITQREFAMVAAMNDITDKREWYTEIFQEEAVDRWRQEAFASTPLMSDRAWEWCMAELRDKAKYYNTHGFIHVLDTGSRVCKSDTLVSQELCSKIREACDSLVSAQVQTEGSKNGVVSLIDPSLYPLVWGKSLVTTVDGDCCIVTQAPEHEDKRAGVDEVQERIDTAMWGPFPDPCRYAEPWKYAFDGESYVNYDANRYSAYLWSYKHQWLPTEVEFTEPGGTAVRLTSYINGVDPKNDTLHLLLTQLVSLCIAPWNDCLIKGRGGYGKPWINLAKEGSNGWAPPLRNAWPQRGRTSCRIITYGPEWENEAPDWIPVFDKQRRRRVGRLFTLKAQVETIKSQKPREDADAEAQKAHKTRLAAAELAVAQHKDEEVIGVDQLPEPTPEQWAMAKAYLERPEPPSVVPVVLEEGWESVAEAKLSRKARRMVRAKHPEPGTAFLYEEWKNGTHGGKAIVDMVTHRPIKLDSPPPRTPHEPYTVALQDEFRHQGLQVIIRADGVTLDAETPVFEQQNWTLSGLKNEHIVATAMFAYDIDDVTDMYVSFRQQTDIMGNAYNFCEMDLYQESATFSQYKIPAHARYKSGLVALCDIFGFKEEEISAYGPPYPQAMQELGSITLKQGRLIVFPNTVEHRMESFHLREKGKNTGHAKWITLMLVDPNYRICSTRNVPSQHDKFSTAEAHGYKREREKEHTLADLARNMLTRTFVVE